LYASGYKDEITGIKTYYESKWLEHGIPIKYLKFRLQDTDRLKEPDIEIEPDSYRSAGRSVKPRHSANNKIL
jgi:tRNA (guanine-N7-)-methyltransferase